MKKTRTLVRREEGNNRHDEEMDKVWIKCYDQKEKLRKSESMFGEKRKQIIKNKIAKQA